MELWRMLYTFYLPHLDYYANHSLRADAFVTSYFTGCKYYIRLLKRRLSICYSVDDQQFLSTGVPLVPSSCDNPRNSLSLRRTRKLKAAERIIGVFPIESVAPFDVGSLPTLTSPGVDLPLPLLSVHCLVSRIYDLAVSI